MVANPHKPGSKKAQRLKEFGTLKTELPIPARKPRWGEDEYFKDEDEGRRDPNSVDNKLDRRELQLRKLLSEADMDMAKSIGDKMRNSLAQGNQTPAPAPTTPTSKQKNSGRGF